MKIFRRGQLSILVAAALFIAGCGGGDSTPTLSTRVVSFGDSLSDLGAYTPATQVPLGQAAGAAPFFGGRFTTNTHTGYSATSNTNVANIWVELVASRLGRFITPALVGFGPVSNRRPCPAAADPVLASSCTGYGQGGSRVSNPAGIGNPNGNGINAGAPAPMTVPMTEQVASHLRAFNAFDGEDIVFVFGGNNDIFVQFGAINQGLPPAAAQANVVTAANELVALVRDQIIAKGAKRVAVMTLPDASATPFGASLGPAGNAQADGARQLLSNLSAQFNATVLAGLNGTAAKIIDTRALNASVLANPASFGLTNVTAPACNTAIISAVTSGRVTDGSSLFCNAAPASAFAAAGIPNLNGITRGIDPTKYLFADGVHPTTAGHKILGDQVLLKLKEFGWVPENL
jgi:phospholipase/lecithinase/hemolysin